MSRSCHTSVTRRFQDKGAQVFGISSDSPAENAAWAKANNLPYPLLTDPSSIMRKVWGFAVFVLPHMLR